MALVKCVECGKEVSSQAAACPHCGMKIPGKSVWPIVAWSIAAVPAAFLVAGLMFGESDQKRQARYDEARTECSKLAAKAALNLPGSFDRGSEVYAIRVLNRCMADRGFNIDPK